MNDIDPQVLEEIRHIQMLIGRNILTFQNVEHLLKCIHHYRQGSGTVNNLAKRKIKIDELSLGRLSDEAALTRIDSKLNSKSDSEFHFSYEILKDNLALNAAIKFFNDINDDRNFLVHNFSTKWQLDKSEHRDQAKSWLLSQYDAIFEQRATLITSLNIIVERNNAVSEFFNSSEGQKAWGEFVSSRESQEITFTFSLQS